MSLTFQCLLEELLPGSLIIFHMNSSNSNLLKLGNESIWSKHVLGSDILHHSLSNPTINYEYIALFCYQGKYYFFLLVFRNQFVDITKTWYGISLSAEQGWVSKNLPQGPRVQLEGRGLKGRFLLIHQSSAGWLIILVLPTEYLNTSHHNTCSDHPK